MSTKIALITGGSRGLGRNMAFSLAKQGLNVVITYHKNAAAAEQTLSELVEMGGNGFALQLDTTAIDSFENFKTQLVHKLRYTFQIENIDFLINNAGFGYHANIAETMEEDFDNLFNVHFKGVYFLTQTMLPLLNNDGGIINISSGLARFSFPGYSAYAAMKGAVEVFTRYLAKELGERKINANTVAPGAIDTDFNKERFEQMPQVMDYIASQTALGRVGQNSDIGGVIAFLCSKESKWINGERIEVSGGMYI